MEVVGVYLLKIVAVAIAYIEKERIICAYMLLKHCYLLNQENCLYTIILIYYYLRAEWNG